jgi:hypothetical protein
MSILKEYEKRSIEEVNRLNGWGLNKDEAIEIVKSHRGAVPHSWGGGMKLREIIEYKLTDINYHTLCALLHEGKYAEAFSYIEEDYGR